MSLEDAKPVRQVDRFAWRPEVSLLTLADRQEALRDIRLRFAQCSVQRRQDEYLEIVTNSPLIADSFLNKVMYGKDSQ